MTTEARVAFLLFFFAVWCFLGLMSWAVAAVLARGRGALPALPLGLAAACAGGVAVPLLGARDFVGFAASLAMALVAGAAASAGGMAVARRFEARSGQGQVEAEGPAVNTARRKEHDGESKPLAGGGGD